jgi:acetyl esterase
VQLILIEPEAQVLVESTAKLPFIFELGPEKGRKLFDEVKSSMVNKLPIDI